MKKRMFQIVLPAILMLSAGISLKATDYFVYNAPHLLLGKNSITDSLRTLGLKDMPEVHPENRTGIENPTPFTQRLWEMALRDVELNITTSADGKKYFGAGQTFGTVVYTRDISFSGILGLNRLYPEIMKSSLEYTRDIRLGLGLLVPEGQVIPEIKGDWKVDSVDLHLSFVRKYKTNPYTRRTDDVVWVWAAYDLFVNNPDLADWEWLYEKVHASFEILYDPFLDETDGLYRGQAAFIDVHQLDKKYTGYPKSYSQADCILVKALSTNALYYKAYKCMSEVCKKTDRYLEAAEWLEKGEILRQAIIDNLRFQDGTFTYFKDKNGNLQPRREALGAALAVITGVVEGEEAVRCLAGYPTTWAGVPLLCPFYTDNSEVYHNNSAWPFVDTFFFWAKEIADGKDYTAQNAALLARATYGGSFREIVNWITKEPARSQSQLWSAAGFVNVCLRAGIVDGQDMDNTFDGFATLNDVYSVLSNGDVFHVKPQNVGRKYSCLLYDNAGNIKEKYADKCGELEIKLQSSGIYVLIIVENGQVVYSSKLVSF